MNYVLYFLFLLLSFNSCSQERIQQKQTSVFDQFSKQEYLSDLQQLSNELKSNHPQMYRYITRDSFDRVVKLAETQITDDMNRGAFLWLCRSITAKVGCGHTFVPTLSRKFNVPDSLIFPVYAQYIEDRLFVIDPLVNLDELPKGAEILRINGIEVSNLKRNISDHIAADGYNKNFIADNINNDFMFYCTYQFNFPKQYSIDYLFEGEVVSLTLKQLNKFENYPTFLNSYENNLSFGILESESIAVITIRSFVYYNDRLAEFKKFIDKSFAKIDEEKIANVILDLRGNGGGDPFAAVYLLQHLTNKPFKYYKDGSTRFYKKLERDISPSDMNFKGDIYTLVDGRTFSTTGHLLSIMKVLNISTFIGKESGATYSCNANTTELTLNNTSISAYIARNTYQTIANELPLEQGIMPDFKVEQNLDDLIENYDRVMQFTLDKILEK